MATLKDVAKKAGVAISTASYALNNDPRVSNRAKEKVLEAARKLGYRPNGIARNLKKQKTDTIGLFLNDLGGPFYSEIIRGVQEVVTSNGYDLIACSTYGGINSTAYRFFEEKRVDGAILLGPSIPDNLIIEVAREDFPIVVLDRELHVDYVYNVLIDNKNGAYSAVNHLINLGYRKIGCLSGPTNSYDNQKRMEGFKKALQEKEVPFVSNWVVQGKFTEEGGYHAMKVLLTNEQLPEAIFSANDEMAIGAIKALEEAGMSVPDDVAVVGFDDIRLASYINPQLTTVAHPKYEWGTMATHMIFQALKGGVQKDAVWLSTSLVVRESCGSKKKIFNLKG